MLQLKTIVFKQFLDCGLMTPHKLCGNMLFIWSIVFCSHCVGFFPPVKVKSGYEDLTGSAEAPARLWLVVNG